MDQILAHIFDDKVCGVKGISRLLISEYCHVVNLKILPFLKKILIVYTKKSYPVIFNKERFQYQGSLNLHCVAVPKIFQKASTHFSRFYI